MVAYKVAVITGSAPGAGTAASTAMSALRRLGIEVETHYQDLGEQRYLRTGELLPAQALAHLRSMDAIFCGSPPSSAHPDIAPGVLERGLLFAMRRDLALAVNVRSFGFPPEPVITVVRENSEGAYFAEPVTVQAGTPAETAVEVAVTTYTAALRCVRHAFSLADGEARRVTLAHKTKVLVASGRIWQRAMVAVATEFPRVEADTENVDTLCARMISDPSRYDVVVSDNVFGDIVSDVACAATGTSAYACSAELPAQPGGPALFEPVHGPQDGRGQPVSLFAALNAAGSLAAYLGQPAIGHALSAAAVRCALLDRNTGESALDQVCAAAESVLAGQRTAGRAGQ